ncbi:maturation protein [ssRNA phage Gephyllon.1_20]|uniref:Maturation protein n=2 Tax=Leviviricetes TaxID=2842243 RepID=A0A8S5KYN8_9VIRU|nr:maturation protein [ssRNA phage Gephyllon.1_20]QDH88791.1 MAG: hypothetical protein H1BulkLitter5836_000001 [Leviviridae sp.]DAD50157.1 TPA_asm: maturation protein [ssRNA phage Gephyllon.1_20]
MVEIRHRERHFSIAAGFATWHDDGLSPAGSSFSIDQYCDDVVGNFKHANYFKSTSKSTKFWTLNGLGDPNGWSYSGFVQYGTPAAPFAPSGPEPDLDALVARGLALCNPNRPNLDLPVFIKELADFPKMIKTLAKLGSKKFGRRPIRDIAEQHLNNEFGVKLFLADLRRMLNFVDLTEKKFQQLKTMRDNGSYGTTRHHSVWGDKSDGGDFTAYASSLYGEGNQLLVKYSCRRHKWLSTRWVPTGDFTSLTDEQLRNRANRIVYGTDISFATIWEGMPWSWLIDWFSNTGDLVQQWRNTVPLFPVDTCAMQTMSVGIDSCNVFSGPGKDTLVATGNPDLWVEKLRIPINAGAIGLDAGVPLLGGRQLSILAAVVVTRWSH